jgi:hypothetical protein
MIVSSKKDEFISEGLVVLICVALMLYAGWSIYHGLGRT